MPRDPEEEERPPPTVTLTQSPEIMSDTPNQEGRFSDYQRQFVIVPEDQQYKGGHPNLHPYVRPLTISDLESSVAMEEAAFSHPEERASRDKVSPPPWAASIWRCPRDLMPLSAADLSQLIYRLTKCGELCLGIFSTVVPGSDIQADTLKSGRPVETDRRNGAVSVLLGHVIATKTTTPVATDASMDYPRDWDAEHPAPSDLGHQEEGRTIVLHCVAIVPQFQGRGLGRVLVMAYMQHMNGAGIADRLVLICRDVCCIPPLPLVSFSNITPPIASGPVVRESWIC
jgi:hypothetical protein